MEVNMKWILAAAGILGTISPAVSSPAWAGPRDDVYAGSARCADIVEDRTWLDCFYGSAQPMRARLGLPAAPMSQTQLVPRSGPGAALTPTPRETAPMPRAAIAASNGPPPMPEDNDSTFGHLFGGVKPIVSNMRMASYTFDRQGLFVVTLEDGEIWQQSQTAANLARWKLPAASYMVSVLPGVMGSYDLKVRGINGYFKVHRLR